MGLRYGHLEFLQRGEHYQTVGSVKCLETILIVIDAI